jgi:hypothetical protein
MADGAFCKAGSGIPPDPAIGDPRFAMLRSIRVEQSATQTCRARSNLLLRLSLIRLPRCDEGGTAMMLPSVSPPVKRPTLVEYKPFVVQLIDLVGAHTPQKVWDVVPGANLNPNDPQRFLHPISRGQACSIFAGFSLASCLGACPRR